MPSSHVIRIPRTDTTEGDDAFILGEVSPSGSKALNLKFVATEGEEPYVVKLRHDRIDDLRASNSACSSEEWERILKSVLLRAEPVEDVEASAEAQTGKSITVHIRRRVAGITQRLGTIKLKYDPNEGIQLFDWCGTAALEREKCKTDLAVARSKTEDLEARVAELKSQLDELTEAKTAAETEMLEKFRLLLNEKKVKIREQQRILSTAKADPSKLAAAAAIAAKPGSSSQDGAAGRAPKPSRAAKRKAAEAESSDESDGFEECKMDIDKEDDAAPPPTAPGTEADADSDEAQQTPDSGDETETGSEPDGEEEEEEEEEEDQPLPPARSSRRKNQDPPPAKGKGKATAKGKGRATASPPAAGKGKGAKETLAVHPKRAAAARKSLSPAPAPTPAKTAVTRHRAAAAAAASAAHPPEGSETESDDEL